MFDGNFRSTREVNLSGNSRRRGGGGLRNQQQSNKRTTNNKRDLLKNAEIQRKQRAEQQRKERSARLIQRVTRGHQGRLHVLQNYIDYDVDNVTAVSMCLSLLPYCSAKTRPKSAKQLLLEHAEQMQDSVPSSTGKALLFSQQRIVQATFQCLTPEDTDEMERQALLAILKLYMPNLSMTIPSFLDLTTCFQKWWTKKDVLTHDVSTTLCRWSMEAATTQPSTTTATTSNDSTTTTTTSTNLSKALMASIFLSAPSFSKMAHQNAIYTTWILPLAEILQTNNNASDDKTNNHQSLLGQAVMKNLQGGKERRVLVNILDIYQQSPQPQDPRPVIQLVHHVLLQNSNNTNEVALLAALLVRGDQLDEATATTASEWGEDDAMEDDDDDDDLDEEEPPASTNNKDTNTKKTTRSNGRYTRKDLQTTLKLDKLYQDQIQQLKRDVTATGIPSDAKALAQKIVRAPWLKWGLEVLGDDTATTTTMTQAYIETLACLLRATTSLRPSAKLNVLSSVAFSKPFMQKLWNYAKQSSSLLAVTVFCDLFAHYLIALSDVNFLQHHTTNNTTGDNGGTASTAVMAEDVILQLRTVLYELYWSKPVMASEIHTERGRLLLAGTKVWNSLYERWNRLMRRPFCEESAWWFPHLSSKEGDGAVLPNGRQQEEDDDDDDSMDVDDDDDNEDRNGGLSAADAETDALADTFQDPKMARILTCIPQALPFDRRVKLFHSLLKADKRKALNTAISNRAMNRLRMQPDPAEMFFGNIREQVQIRRAALYQDSMDQLNSMGPRLKHQIQVSFINQHGAEEAGIDGGGVFKEFLDDLIKDGFAVKDGNSGNNSTGAPPLFAVTPLQTLAVNFDMQESLAHYEFVGRVLGKAVYESILVEPQFCLPFLNQLLAKPNTMEDLKNYDEEYYKNLTKLRQLNETEINSLELTFELTVSSGSSTPSPNSIPRTVELIPGGRSIAVTKQNVFQYIHLVAHQLLNVQGARQTKAFLRGFRDLIPASWVRLFSANELQKLISGDDSVRGIDVPLLKKSMHYLGGYHITQPYIQDFWDILETEFTPEQQRKFLRFMTSCSRQPLLGFASLDPVPSIQQIRLSQEEQHSKNSKLPTSQTCMNLLKLPNYNNRQLLKEKLLAAIESGAGFELT